MAKGTLHGVGVGPGDPGLVTLKALEVIASCPVVAAPRTPGGGMIALDIAQKAIDLSGKTVLPLDFAMSRDAGERAASHNAAASLLRPHLDNGFSVAMLNLGDVSIYASFRYVADILGTEGYPVSMVPGVTSFCAAASLLGMSLTGPASPLHILPDATEIGENGFTTRGTRIWMKTGRHLPDLLRQLRELGLLHKAMLVQNCGMPNQRVCRDLESVDVASEYFSLVILKDDA